MSAHTAAPMPCLRGTGGRPARGSPADGVGCLHAIHGPHRPVIPGRDPPGALASLDEAEGLGIKVEGGDPAVLTAGLGGTVAFAALLSELPEL